MRLYEKIIVAAVVVLPLAVGFLGAPLIRPDTLDLNRNPARLPEVRAAGVLDAETYEAIAAWLRDRVPFRREIRQIEAKINRGVFRDIDDVAILQGREGWLFFDSAIALGLAPDFDPRDVRAGILRLKQEVEAAGKTFLFAFGPHKETVYPQYLSNRDRLRQERVRERLENFRDLMRREPVQGFIDAWDALEAAAATAPEPLYYPRDTHWTPLGAVELTRRIVAALDPGMPLALEAIRGRERAYTPDLVRFAGLGERETITVWDFARAGVKSERNGAESGGKTRTISYKARARGKTRLLPKIAVICDSYGTSMRPSLRQFFDETTFIATGSGHTATARRALAEADIVLFVRVERFLYLTTEETPFGGDSAEVLDMLAGLRAGAERPAPKGLTRAAAAVSGSGAHTEPAPPPGPTPPRHRHAGPPPAGGGGAVAGLTQVEQGMR